MLYFQMYLFPSAHLLYRYTISSLALCRELIICHPYVRKTFDCEGDYKKSFESVTHFLLTIFNTDILVENVFIFYD